MTTKRPEREAQARVSDKLQAGRPASMANGGILMHNTERLSLLSYIRPKTDRFALPSVFPVSLHPRYSASGVLDARIGPGGARSAAADPTWARIASSRIGAAAWGAPNRRLGKCCVSALGRLRPGAP